MLIVVDIVSCSIVVMSNNNITLIWNSQWNKSYAMQLNEVRNCRPKLCSKVIQLFSRYWLIFAETTWKKILDLLLTHSTIQHLLINRIIIKSVWNLTKKMSVIFYHLKSISASIKRIPFEVNFFFAFFNSHDCWLTNWIVPYVSFSRAQQLVAYKYI